jgi:phosphomannomutase/phosphoglucomutase
MQGINPKIFREYDIRGVYGEDLTDEVAEEIGRACGTLYLGMGVGEVVVGHDNRVSSPAVSLSLIKGLLSTGCNVCDVDTVLTPMIYFSWYGIEASGAIITTASHNPAEFNGFKITAKRDVVTGEKVFGVLNSGNYRHGQGKVRQFDLAELYFEEIISKIRLSKSLNVVIDAGNGTAGIFAPKLFRGLGCEVLELFCESDGNFPNHDPYPQKVEYYTKMVEMVKENKADLGIAFDGDADRFNVCDENGNFLGSDVLIALFAKEILKERPGSKVVVNVVNSQAVIDFIKQIGGVPIIWKVGYPNIQRKLKEEGGVLGGEISGHLYFADRYYGFDDAIYTACRVFELMGEKGMKLSQIYNEVESLLPKYFSTKEERIDCPEEKKFEIVSKVAEDWKRKFSRVLDIDGVRVQFEDGWGLIRASNTESKLSIRAEAKTEKRLKEIKNTISTSLKPYKPQVNLNWQ